MDKITDCLRIAHPPLPQLGVFPHNSYHRGVVSTIYLKAGAKIFLQYSIFLYGGGGTNLKWYSGTSVSRIFFGRGTNEKKFSFFPHLFFFPLLFFLFLLLLGGQQSPLSHPLNTPLQWY